MTAHPAHPTRRELSIAATATTIIDADIAAAQKMRRALATAAELIRGLKFVCGSPVIGYDIEHVLAGLADMMPPPDSVLYSQIEGEATPSPARPRPSARRMRPSTARNWRGRMCGERRP